MSFFYGLIADARSRRIKVEHAECVGNAPTAAAELLTKLKKDGFHSAISDERYLFSYLKDDEIIAVCLSDIMDLSIASKFLTKLRNSFNERHKVDESDDKLMGFKQKIAEIMKEFNSGSSKVNLVDRELDKLESQLVENMSRRGLSRGFD